MSRRVARGARTVDANGRAAIARALERGAPGDRDEFGELAGALRAGRRTARELEHELGHWKRRPFAPNTAATTHCRRCSKVICVDLSIGTAAHGPAATGHCTGG